MFLRLFHCVCSIVQISLVMKVMFWIGALLLYSAKGVESIYVGRCVVGWAVAVSGIADVGKW